MATWYAQYELHGQLTQDQVDDIADHGGITAAHLDTDSDRHQLQITVEAADHERAAAAANETLRSLPHIHTLTVDAVTVQTRQAHDRGLDVVGAAEAAAMLGVTASRLRQLRDRPDAPKPVATLAGGALYRRAEVAAYARQERPQGRPRKAAA